MRIYNYQIEKELSNLNEIDSFYFKSYVDKLTVKKNKLIRTNENNEYQYFCTNCKCWHSDKKVLYKETKLCPNCKKIYEVITKRNKMRKISDYITVLEINNRCELIIRCFYFYKEFNKKLMSFEFDCFEVERINLDRDIYMKLNTYSNMCTICHCRDSREIKRDKKRGYHCMALVDNYFYGYVITKNIKKLIKKTKYKYSCVDKIARKNIDVLEYLKLYESDNRIELLVKNNNFNLIKYFARNGVISYLINNRKNFKYLKHDLTLKEFENAVYFDLQDYDKIKKYAYLQATSHIKSLNKIEINTNKLIEYLYQQKQQIHYYRDYYEAAKKIGLPIYKKEHMFPKSLEKEHDFVTKEYAKIEQQLRDQGIKSYAKELSELIFEKSGLVIFPATSQAELINESNVLEHCVRQYAERVANRETSIFMIRKKNNRDKPFYTLELENKKIVQIRGKNNCAPSEKEKKFIHKWAKKYELNDDVISS